MSGVACSTSDDPPAAASTPFTVKLIGFNDFHGTLQSPGTFGVNTTVPTAQRPAVGGADYLAAYVDKLKAQNPLNAVVGAGDFIGASPLISSLFHDEPAIEALNRMGLKPIGIIAILQAMKTSGALQAELVVQ